MTKENVSVEISMPLIDDIELQSIDIFYNDIVSEYTKAFVKEKDQVIAQRLMMNLQQENMLLKKENKQLKEEKRKVRDYINKHCVNEKISKEVGYKCYTMADTNELEKIMKILGDKE